MAFLVSPNHTSRFKQHLRNLGPGPLIVASKVRVYRGDRIVRVETPTGRRIHRRVLCQG